MGNPVQVRSGPATVIPARPGKPDRQPGGFRLTGPADFGSTDIQANMPSTKPPSGSPRARLLVRLSAGAIATLAGSVSAELESELDPLVVSALRFPGELSSTTSVVGRLDPAELRERGVLDLRQALNEVPGVIATSTAGQTGAVGSVFIRGTTTADSVLVVDGIRLSDATAPLGNFFAGARLDDLDRIEVLRGPQSAIHGGEAVGGVIWLETARGSGDPGARLRAEGGSFATTHAHLSHSGRQGGVSWFAGIGHDATRNDASRQDFDQLRGSMRLEWAASDRLDLGFTLRAIDSRFDYPFFGANTDSLDALLGTVHAHARFTGSWHGRFTLGHYRENYDNDGPFGNFGTDLDRSAFHTDHRVAIGGRHHLLAGGFVEHSDFENTIGTDVGRDRLGAYLGWQWQALEELVADAVARWEDDQSHGDEVTWRLGGSWEPRAGTRLRGGLGTAFRTPTLLDLYGTAFGAGNPNLRAQTSLGWDLGIEHRYLDSHLVSLTWFENSIEDRIQSFPTPPVNLPGDTPTRGLETALAGSWCHDCYRYRLAWTWLTDSLQDQPRHSATASLDWRPTERLLFGIGASYVDDRSYGGLPLDDYFLLRLYSRFQVRENLTLHARVENLTNSDYQLARFPFSPVIDGPGLAFHGGLTLEF